MVVRTQGWRLRPALIAAVALVAGPASAQFFERPYGPFTYNSPPAVFDPLEAWVGRGVPLSPSAIVERLEDRGFDDVGRPRSNGQAYVVEATSPRGRRVSLIVDPIRGVILDRMPIGDPRGREEADSPDDRRRDALRPGRPYPPEISSEPSTPAERAPRREAARPSLGGQERASPGEPAWRDPVDPRLAPAPRGAARTPDDRPGEPVRTEPVQPPRQAARPEPGAGSSVYGTNPGAAPVRRRTFKPAASGTPAEDVPVTSAPPASRPQPTARTSPTPPVERPTVERPPVDRAPVQASAAPLAKPRGPVRIIEGVTPINPGAAPATPSAAPEVKRGPGADE